MFRGQIWVTDPCHFLKIFFFANQAQVWGQLTNGKPGKAQLICELCRKSDVMMVNVLCVNVLECSFAAFHTHWCCGWFSVTSVLLETVQLYITVVKYCTQSDQQSFFVKIWKWLKDHWKTWSHRVWRMEPTFQSHLLDTTIYQTKYKS